MSKALLIVLATAGLSGAVASADVPDGPALRLKLTRAAERYLLGDPVRLRVVLENAGKEPITVRLPSARSGIRILISEEGAQFNVYREGIFGIGSASPKPETLQPGQTWEFEVRILYQYDRPSRLAFEHPGTFFVKIQHVYAPSPAGRLVTIESNVVSVQIEQPTGENAQVWERIKSPAFLYFLQSGLDRDGDKAVPRKAVELLETFPKTTYAGALKYALGEYYRRRWRHMTRDEVIRDPELERIRAVTGIVEPPEGPFPDDRRLDAEITTHFPEWTPWEEVLQEVSSQTGVPLRLAPELREGKRKGLRVTESLRRFMRSMDAHDRKWVRDGEGYRLVPVPEPKWDRTTGDATAVAGENEVSLGRIEDLGDRNQPPPRPW